MRRPHKTASHQKRRTRTISSTLGRQAAGLQAGVDIGSGLDYFDDRNRGRSQMAHSIVNGAGRARHQVGLHPLQNRPAQASLAEISGTWADSSKEPAKHPRKYQQI
jgi:hypothetical protein